VAGVSVDVHGANDINLLGLLTMHPALGSEKWGRPVWGVLRMADPLLTGFLCQKTVMDWPYECWKTLSQGRS
jgi:hypothetical protein